MDGYVPCYGYCKKKNKSPNFNVHSETKVKIGRKEQEKLSPQKQVINISKYENVLMIFFNGLFRPIYFLYAESHSPTPRRS